MQSFHSSRVSLPSLLGFLSRNPTRNENDNEIDDEIYDHSLPGGNSASDVKILEEMSRR